MPDQGVMAAATRLFAIAIALVAATAAGVWATASAAQMRTLLGLSFAGVPSTGAEAQAIALHNAALCACPILGATLTPGHRTRAAITIALSGLLVANCVVLGLSSGAYGFRVVRPHVLLELIAFSVAGGIYMAAHSVRSEHLRIISVAAGCTALIAAAAVLEARLV